MLQKIRHLLRALPVPSAVLSAILLVPLYISACDSQKEQSHDPLVVDGSSINVSLPQRLRAIEAIDPAAIRVIATVNGVETELQLNNEGRFTGQFAVPAQSVFTIQVDYVEFFSGQQLILARAEKSVTTNTTDTSLSLLPQDYDFSSFDSDGDSASNILERQFNTNPLDSAQLPELVEVEVFAELPVPLNNAGFTRYQLVGSLGGESVAVDAAVGQFRHTFVVNKQDNLIANMRLVESVTGQNLTIGQHEDRLISDSQFNAQNSALVVFNGASWNLDNDQDADGSTDAEELIAGTDVLNGPVSNRIPYRVAFDVPAEIANPQSVFATLEIDGISTALTRTADTYSASGTVEPGRPITLDAQIVDTIQGTALVLATFSGTVTPVANGTLQLQGFSTQHDADNDGVQNYLELAQGTDPFAAPVPAAMPAPLPAPMPPAPPITVPIPTDTATDTPTMQCTPVSETLFANLTDDAYVQNSTILNNNRLQVDSNRRVTLMRFQYDDSLGEVTAANLSLTVGTDVGDGLLTVSSVADFDWSEEGSSLAVPTGDLAGSAENNWQTGVAYSFALNPGVLSGDMTLVLRQASGNDVAFQSSAARVAPTLELTIERCQ